MKILYNDKNAVVVCKSAGIPTQADTSGDKDALTLTCELLSSMGERAQLYLVHRLDRVVGGVIAFAKNKRAAAELSRLAAEERLGKEYLAVVDGVCEGGVMRDLLCKNAALGKAVVTDEGGKGAKEAVLEYEPLATATTPRGEKTLVKVKLKTGRFHQIRAQFSSRGLPLTGDGKYGSTDKSVRQPSLFAISLDFELFGERIKARELPDTQAYPWNLFSEDNYR